MVDSFRFQSKSCLFSKIKEILARAWIYIMQGCLSLLNTFFMKDYRNYVVRISWFTRRWTLYLWLHTKFAHRSISSIIHIESRIHKSFDRIPFVRSEIRMKIKKELTGRIRRGQTRGVTEREKKTGEIWPTGWREQGEKQFDSHNIQPAHWWSMQSCPNSRYIVLACWPDLAKYIALSGRGQLRL